MGLRESCCTGGKHVRHLVPPHAAVAKTNCRSMWSRGIRLQSWRRRSQISSCRALSMASGPAFSAESSDCESVQMRSRQDRRLSRRCMRRSRFTRSSRPPCKAVASAWQEVDKHQAGALLVASSFFPRNSKAAPPERLISSSTEPSHQSWNSAGFSCLRRSSVHSRRCSTGSFLVAPSTRVPMCMRGQKSVCQGAGRRVRSGRRQSPFGRFIWPAASGSGSARASRMSSLMR